MAFVHLHNHTQYSLLDGACRVDKMVNLAKEYDMLTVAMTDHGNMFGTIDFYNKANKAGIKPIIGMEAYIVNDDLEDPKSKTNPRHHLVLLVKNLQGYKNLMKLSSIAYTKGFYYRPRISKKVLEEHHEGLICLSACLAGEIPSLLLKKKYEEAEEVIAWYKKLFPDAYYIELMNHGLEEEVAVLPELVKIAEKTNTPMVVTNDCHYLKREDAKAHEVLLCIQTGKSLADPDRMTFESHELYFKTEQEMRDLFPNMDSAFENTVKIAKQVEFDLPYKDFLFPKTDLPEGFTDPYLYLRHLCDEGIKQKYGEETKEIRDRLDFELDVIHQMGYVGYFLIVKDFIDAARDREIPVGPGRGSAAGSIVAYLLDITRLDPLKYGLLFERFLDLERVGMPDIDIDFCAEGRGEVIEYVVEKYGRPSVSQIVTFGTLGAKSVIKDVARVLDVAPAEANRITKLMPSGPKVTLAKALKEAPEFAEYMAGNEIYKSILEYSMVLEGLIRQIGIHAAGVVIGPGDLSDYAPVAISSQKDGPPAVLVQYEGKWLDDLKMLKMDFLGLKTLTVIKRAIQLVKDGKNIDIDIDNVDLTDQKAYELLSMGMTDGIFQFESAGMKKYLKELKPTCFDDIIAMVALYRPGPIQFIPNYINRKHGIEPIEYDHELTKAALEETYGVTVYQEQVMRISKEMSGFTSAEAGQLRKAISKKKEDLMNKMHIKFADGAVKNGVKRETADKIWKDWEGFANYAFNKSHAACYAFIAFQTAYLKAHYPVEFMAALLTMENDPAKIPYFLDECKNMGIRVIPPNVNESFREFSVKDGAILFGLRGIKNVGSAAIAEIIRERDADGKFTSIFQFCERLDTMIVNKTVVESLIFAGATDELEGNRAQQYASIEDAQNNASVVQAEKNSDQINLFDAFHSDNKEEKSYDYKLPDVNNWTIREKLEHEKSVLGFYISGHPLQQHKHIIDYYCNCNSVDFKEKNVRLIKIMGLVSEVKTKMDRRGNPMAFITLEDSAGKFEVSLFKSDYEKFFHMMQEGAELFIVGAKSTYGNGDDSFLRVLPSTVVTGQNVEHLSGNMDIELSKEYCMDNVNKNLAMEFDRTMKESPGKIKINLIINTDKYGKLKLCKGKYSIFPSGKAFSSLNLNVVNSPKIQLTIEESD